MAVRKAQAIQSMAWLKSSRNHIHLNIALLVLENLRKSMTQGKMRSDFPKWFNGWTRLSRRFDWKRIYTLTSLSSRMRNGGGEFCRVFFTDASARP
jgi:hypothetical protein